MNILEEMADGLKLKESTKVVRRNCMESRLRAENQHLPSKEARGATGRQEHLQY